jgi:hypothetical protein
MKKLLLLISLTVVSATSFGQWQWNLNFEDTTYLHRVFIDTISNPNCIWQIGHPAKTIFNSAYSVPNVIVTDTLNPYPINDTSSFIITHIRPGNFGGNESLLLDFYFKLNTDSLADYGIIEASLDNGTSWINLMTQDTTYGLNWINPKPILTGNTNGWVHYSEDIRSLTYMIGYSDTVLYRFTFISDSVQTNKEGWMLDDFLFNDSWEGIPEYQNDNLISISPNPTSNELRIHTTKIVDKPTIQILNYTGQILYDKLNFIGETIDTRQLPNGIYLLKYSDTKSLSVKKFVVQH